MRINGLRNKKPARARAAWHIARRDEMRRAVDAAASAFCGRPVTGYGERFYLSWH